MKISNSETITHRRTRIELYRDSDGFWGWIIGGETLLATFSSRGSALYAAQRHIDDRK